jgi:2-polyprenyl-3-methyl-5-hydroxy-6-metoxy-1,4-benzoquinol methylase
LAAGRLEGISRTVELELSEEVSRHAAEKYGVEVYCRTIQQFASEGQAPFDVVVINAVLEHVHDPSSMIGAAARNMYVWASRQP